MIMGEYAVNSAIGVREDSKKSTDIVHDSRMESRLKLYQS